MRLSLPVEEPNATDLPKADDSHDPEYEQLVQTSRRSRLVSRARQVLDVKEAELTPLHPMWWVAFTRLVARRITEQQLTQVAASLTFTTVLSLIPMATVILAVFTAFPMFERFQSSLQGYLVDSFFPVTLSKIILTYVNEFSTKAKGLTAVGTFFLIVTAISTMFTVDRVFNQIWHVHRPRTLVNKVMLYWAVITLAPMLIALSLSVSTALIGQSLRGINSESGFSFLLACVPIVCTILAFALIYQIVPNRTVRMKDAMAGGVLAALLFEISKRAFAAYITHFPSYTALYGALAAFPIFLLWIYVSWNIVLLGAATVAALPVARTGHWDAVERPGQRWLEGLSVLTELEKSRQTDKPGMTMEELRLFTHVPPDRLDDILTLLIDDGVLGLLAGTKSSERFVLICDPQMQSAEVVAKALWFDSSLLLDWKERLPSSSSKLYGFDQEFVQKPKLIDWLEA